MKTGLAVAWKRLGVMQRPWCHCHCRKRFILEGVRESWREQETHQAGKKMNKRGSHGGCVDADILEKKLLIKLLNCLLSLN